MAYRQIHVEIWDDPWFVELNPQEKLLFIYLFSNARTNTIGLYELSERVIAFETGLSPDVITAGLDRFHTEGKALSSGSWVWVPKLLTRNITNFGSPKIRAMLERQIIAVPDNCPFKVQWIENYNTVVAPQYRIDTIAQGIDTVPQPQIPSVVCCDCGVSDLHSVSDLSSVSVSEADDVEPDEPDERTQAISAWVSARGGAVNSMDVDRISDWVAEFEEHRQGLPRGTPGADVHGGLWVREAITTGHGAMDGKLLTLNYTEGILRRWKAQGYKAKFGKAGSAEKKVKGI